MGNLGRNQWCLVLFRVFHLSNHQPNRVSLIQTVSIQKELANLMSTVLPEIKKIIVLSMPPSKTKGEPQTFQMRMVDGAGDPLLPTTQPSQRITFTNRREGTSLKWMTPKVRNVFISTIVAVHSLRLTKTETK